MKGTLTTNTGINLANTSLMTFGGVHMYVTDVLNTDTNATLLLEDGSGDRLAYQTSVIDRLESNSSGMLIANKNFALGHEPDFSLGSGKNVLILEKGVGPSFPVDGQGNKIMPSTQAYLYAVNDSESEKVHLFTMDAGGSETRLGPHNSDGEWEYFSRNIHTGKTIKINMEKMIRKLEKFTGEKFIEEE